MNYFQPNTKWVRGTLERCSGEIMIITWLKLNTFTQVESSQNPPRLFKIIITNPKSIQKRSFSNKNIPKKYHPRSSPFPIHVPPRGSPAQRRPPAAPRPRSSGCGRSGRRSAAPRRPGLWRGCSWDDALASDLPSGQLENCHWKLPIYGWFIPWKMVI